METIFFTIVLNLTSLVSNIAPLIGVISIMLIMLFLIMETKGTKTESQEEIDQSFWNNLVSELEPKFNKKTKKIKIHCIDLIEPMIVDLKEVIEIIKVNVIVNQVVLAFNGKKVSTFYPVSCKTNESIRLWYYEKLINA